MMNTEELKKALATGTTKEREDALWEMRKAIESAKMGLYDVFCIYTDDADMDRFDHPSWAAFKAADSFHKSVSVEWTKLYRALQEAEKVTV